MIGGCANLFNDDLHRLRQPEDLTRLREDHRLIKLREDRLPTKISAGRSTGSQLVVHRQSDHRSK